MVIKVLFALLMTAVAISVFIRGTQTDFHPIRRTQSVLFVAGFASMFGWSQVLFHESSQDILWLSIFMGSLFGLFWAFTAPKRWRFVQRQQRKRNGG